MKVLCVCGAIWQFVFDKDSHLLLHGIKRDWCHYMVSAYAERSQLMWMQLHCLLAYWRVVALPSHFHARTMPELNCRMPTSIVPDRVT